jgi:hypothetical protein
MYFDDIEVSKMRTPLDVWFEMTRVEKVKTIGFCITMNILLWASVSILIIVS